MECKKNVETLIFEHRPGLRLTQKYTMKSLPCFLLLSGGGQNTGKTTLGCLIVERLCLSNAVYVLKVSPHLHDPGPALPAIAWGEGFMIYEETQTDTTKDSSRYLAAGAERVYFITCQRSQLGKAIKEALKLIPPGVPVVCESGGLAEFYKPGLHVHLAAEHAAKTPSSAPDVLFWFDGKGFEPNPEGIFWDNHRWVFKARR